ncbi:MAG: mandelate racemase/muconate lactonizing enzyme family protein [Pseudomonadota bacterium]
MISNVEAECFRLPLKESLVDAAHGEHHFFELVLCHVRTSKGFEGTGYTYTGGKGGRAIAEFLRTDVAQIALGEPANEISAIWSKLQTGLHYVGRGGLLSFAIAALDIGLWDAAAKQHGKSIASFLTGGKQVGSVKTYAGFIDLHLDGDSLSQLAESALSKGFIAVKTKVGRDVMAEDVSRVGLLRSVIGASCDLMVDANFALDIDRSIKFSRAIEEFDIAWFEEPISPDDFEGYGKIAKATNIPLAMGENLHIVEEFERAIQYSKLTYLQPDASNVGGITGWLKVAQMARDAKLTVCTHGMHELHVSLLAALEDPGCLEFHSFPIDEFAMHRLELKDGKAVVPDRPGIGVEFDHGLLKPHKIS